MDQATLQRLDARRQQAATINCGPCMACCSRDRIVLDPARDNFMLYQWVEDGDQAILDHKPNGDCIHLTDSGCGVHDNPPDVCKRFDCAVLAALTPPHTRAQRIAIYPHMSAVYAAGDDRKHTLKD